MISQPPVYYVPKKQPGDRKLRKCKHGERLPNGKCPKGPKKIVNNTSVINDVDDDEESEDTDQIDNQETQPVVSINVTEPNPPVLKTSPTKKKRPCKHGERLANGKCPPPSKTVKKALKVKTEKIREKYKNGVCTDDMTFEDCELAILRQSVIENEETIKKDSVMNEDSREMIEILEKFLRRKRCICYGGTAINNILPEKEQFYNRDVEIPDYDFYSKTAKDDAKELADIYFLAGFREVEAKSGVHESTYKVFVNFVGIADITQLDERIFDNLQKSAIEKEGILYSSPNFLRMASYLELSRPRGDVSRWEKVFKRIILLNKYYPLTPEHNCDILDFQRKMDFNDAETSEKIFNIAKDTFLEEKVVFFGGYAFSVYADFFTNERQKKFNPKIPDFDVLSLTPKKTAEKVAQRLADAGIQNIFIYKHDKIGEIIPENYQITIGANEEERDTIAFVYSPIACHSYNEVSVDGQKIFVATINTILSFYLAFMFVNKWYYNKDRILCMSQYLFDLEQANRLEQTGPLKRFTTNCLGKQKTLTDMFSIKSDVYKKIGRFQNKTPAQLEEFEKFFFKYIPSKNPRHASIMNSKIQQNQQGVSKPPVNYVLESDSNLSDNEEDKEEETHEVYVPPNNRPVFQNQNKNYVRPNIPFQGKHNNNNNKTQKKKYPPKNDGFFSRIF